MQYNIKLLSTLVILYSVKQLIKVFTGITNSSSLRDEFANQRIKIVVTPLYVIAVRFKFRQNNLVAKFSSTQGSKIISIVCSCINMTYL